MNLPDHAIEIVRTLAQTLDNPYTDATPSLAQAKLKDLDNTLQLIKREVAIAHARHTAEKDVLKAELHCEAVDREANAARVAERQRFLFERAVALPGQGDASERASASAAYVEAALASLCPHTLPPAAGCEALAAHDA